MQTFRGQPGADGLVRARAKWITREDGAELDSHIGREEVLSETERARLAMLSVAQELQRMAGSLSPEVSANTRGIFLAEAEFAQDPQAFSLVAHLIKQRLCTAEAAVKEVFERFAAEIGRRKDPVIASRSSDVMDVSLRIMTALRGSVRDLPRFDQPCIALAPEFSPYQIAMLAKANVLGIATIRGGAASHAAILSRALGIPSVLAVGDSLRVIRDGEELLLDGSAGEITLSPTPDRVAAYESRERLVRGQSHEECDDRPAVTRDGHRIKVLANVSTMNDVEAARACGAEGVGLLRTELLFLGRKTAPPVDEQCAVYSHAARLFPEEGVVVRALDLGGDKALPFIQDHPGLNPLLGVRGIRLLLKNEELFRAQITSILMASTSGKVAMMVPFVTTVEEVERARELLLDESQRLSAPIEFGIMIETPSAALEARRLARLCDFFSIGTNDLVQHTMASDRTNAELSTLLRADSPAVLRLINEVISSARVAGIRVSVCGESAYSDKVAPLLIGLGVDELSVPPAMVRRTKEIVRMTDRMEAAREALSLLR